MAMHDLTTKSQRWTLVSVARHQKWGFEPNAVAYLHNNFGFTDRMRESAEKWLKKNADCKFLVKGDTFYFECLNDAMQFWLVHCDPSNLKT